MAHMRNVEAELVRLGYVPIRHPSGKKLWAEPGFPGIERSGFVAAEPGEVEAMLEQVAAAREAVGMTDEEIEQLNREKLQGADECPKWSAADAIDRLEQIEENSTTPAPGKDDAAA
jgi:hypothetical protein